LIQEILCKPFYTHDSCANCQFMGHAFYQSETKFPADLYWCIDTIIIRFGNNPWDYVSAHLSTALKLALSDVFIGVNMWRYAISKLIKKGVLTHEKLGIAIQGCL